MRCASCGTAFDAAQLERLGQLEYTQTRVTEWAGQGEIDEVAGARMLGQLAIDLAEVRRQLGVSAPAVAGSQPPPMPAETPEPATARTAATSAGQAALVPPPAVATARAPRPPSPWQAWLHSLRQQVAAEVALHGLLYFGVLLTFVGTLGFALFAFGSVNVSLRPVAEVLAPVLLFGASWFLRRNRLQLAAGSLELLAGAVTLVALFTSLNDGARIPPDLSGPALAIGWAVCSLVLMAVYALVARGRPESALRFLIAPLFWASLWSLGMLANNGHLSVWQYPLAAAGIVFTLGIAKRYPSHVLAQVTRRVAMVGLPLAYALVIVFALGAGWPAWPMALTALAVIAGSELLDESIRVNPLLPPAQSLLAALTLLALVPDWGLARVGLAGVLVAIALLEWHGRRSTLAAASFDLLIGAGGLLLAFPQSSAAAVAWGAAVLWLHLRTLWFPRALSSYRWWPLALDAVLPAGFAYHLWLSVDHSVAWLIMACALLAVATLLRRWPSMERIGFYGWYLPPAAAAVLLGAVTARQPVGLAASIELPMAAALLAPVFGLSARCPLLRLWGAAVAAAGAIWLALAATQAASDVQAVVWAAAGLAVASVALVWRQRPLSAHLLVVAYLSAGAALAGPTAASMHFAVLSAWLLVGLAAVFGQEAERASLGWIVNGRARLSRALAQLPLVVLLGSIPFWVIHGGDLFAIFAQRGRAGVALSLTGLCYGLAANRLARRRPLAPITAVGAVVVATIGISVAVPALIASTVAVVISIATVVILGGSLRRPYMTWLAWALSAVLVLLASHIFGVTVSALPRVLMGWAVVCLIGGLAYDDIRNGRRNAGEGLRSGWLLQPVVLGALGLPAALAFTFSGPPSTFGWWALAAAAAYLVVAWLLRAGAVSFATWALASLAATVLLPWNAWLRPELWVAQAAVLLLLAFALSLRRLETRWWARWDIASLTAAHLVALVALTRSTSAGSMAVTWAGFGVLALALAAWKRNWMWAAAGALLLLIGSNLAGPGWFALTLGLSAIALTGLAWRTDGWLRAVAQWSGAGAAGWAWWEMLLWTGWSQSRQLDATFLALAALTVCSTALARSGRTAPSRLFPWGALELGGLQACLLVLVASGRGPSWTAAAAFAALSAASVALAPIAKGGLRPLAQWASAGAAGAAWWSMLLWTAWSQRQQVDVTLLALAVAAICLALTARLGRIAPSWLPGWTVLGAFGLGACVLIVLNQACAFAQVPGCTPLRTPWNLAIAFLAFSVASAMLVSLERRLREVSAVLLFLAGLAAGSSLALTRFQQLGATVVIGLVALVLAAASPRVARLRPWLGGLLSYSALQSLAAVVLAASMWPDRSGLVATLAILGVETAVAGIVLHRASILAFAPPLLCTSWLLFATEGAGGGDVQWVTVPVGLAILAVVEIARWPRRPGVYEPVPTEVLLLMELTGIAFLCGAALVEALTVSALYGFMAVLWGLLICGWALATRFRRRLRAGVAIASLGLFLVVAVPLARLVPEIRGVALWATLAGLGALFLLIATTLEQSRARVGSAMRHLSELTEVWE